MTTATVTRLYECMFLISQGEAANLNNVIEHIGEIIGKGGAEIIAIRKWDDRRLAYEIDKQKRGVFILAYINSPTDGLSRIERECSLSEHIMRLITIRVDHMTEEQARSADDRDGLAVEAKLRAEKAAAGENEKRSGARLGAPTPEEMPKTETPAPEEKAEVAAEPEADAESKDADAKPESKPEAE